MKFFKTFASRYVRFFLLGLIFFVVLESAGLLWLDKVYFRADSHVSVSTLDSSAFARKKAQKANVPVGATNIQYSYDGGYLSYIFSGRLVVVDTDTGTQHTVPGVSGESMKIAQYGWVNQRDRIILTEKSADSYSSNYIRFYYYVPSNPTELQEMDDTVNNQRVSINLSRLRTITGSSATVSDMDFSIIYSTVYAKVRDRSGRSLLYMLNIDNQLTRVDTYTTSLGRIAAYQQSTGLLYENADRGYVYSWAPTQDGGTVRLLTADGTKKLRLLGVDGEDNIYLAPTTGSTTTSVLAGTVKGGWQTVSLGQATPISRITVSLAGKIYVDDPDEHVLRNITDSTQTSYTGALVGLYTDGFFTRSDGVSQASSGTAASSDDSSSGVAGGTFTVVTNSFAADPLSVGGRPAA